MRIGGHMDRDTKGFALWPRFAAAACMAVAIAGASLATSGSVAASNTSDPAITAFSVSAPCAGSLGVTDVITGPDGALWFIAGTEGASALGRVTTSGTVSVFPAPSGWLLEYVTSGGGSLWVSEFHGGAPYIGQWSSDGVLVHEYPVAGAAMVFGITWGPDAAVWFVSGTTSDSGGLSGGFIGRMTTMGTVTKYTLPASTSGLDNGGDSIVPGPDGALWFDLPPQGAVGRITVSGTVSEFALPGSEHGTSELGDEDLTAGPDGAMWIASFWTGGIQRVTTGGNVSTIAAPSSLSSITSAPDGDLWFTTAFGGAVADRMTTSGHVTASYALPPAYPTGDAPITAGPDGKLWIGVQRAIEQLDPSVAPGSTAPSPTPTSSATPAPSPCPTTTTAPAVSVPSTGGSSDSLMPARVSHTRSGVAVGRSQAVASAAEGAPQRLGGVLVLGAAIAITGYAGAVALVGRMRRTRRSDS